HLNAPVYGNDKEIYAVLYNKLSKKAELVKYEKYLGDDFTISEGEADKFIKDNLPNVNMKDAKSTLPGYIGEKYDPKRKVSAYIVQDKYYIEISHGRRHADNYVLISDLQFAASR